MVSQTILLLTSDDVKLSLIAGHLINGPDDSLNRLSRRSLSIEVQYIKVYKLYVHNNDV